MPRLSCGTGVRHDTPGRTEAPSSSISPGMVVDYQRCHMPQFELQAGTPPTAWKVPSVMSSRELRRWGIRKAAKPSFQTRSIPSEELEEFHASPRKWKCTVRLPAALLTRQERALQPPQSECADRSLCRNEQYQTSRSRCRWRAAIR